MSDYSIFQTANSEIKDPELRKLVDHVTDMLKLSVYQSVYYRAQNNPLKYQKLNVGVAAKKEYDSVGEVLDQSISNREMSKVKAFQENSDTRSILTRPTFINVGRAPINFKSAVYTSRQIDIKSTFGYINDHLLVNRIGSLFDIYVSPAAVPVVEGLTLKLNLLKIICNDETNPEWLGKDEISGGGVAMDDKNNESKIAEFFVKRFNDHDEKSYNPDKVLKSFPLDGINPSSFAVLFTLAEKDDGGFATFLTKLYQSVRAELTLILTGLGAAAGVAIGAAIGGTVGTAVAGPVGTIIGVVAGLIVGALWSRGCLPHYKMTYLSLR